MVSTLTSNAALPILSRNVISSIMIDIASVTLAIRDLDRVASFYRNAIGLTPISADATSVWLGVDGRKLLHLLHRQEFRPVDPAAAGLFHTAFLLPTRADLGRWLTHATTSGITLQGAADHLVSEAVYLADPEGNGIEIYADRPRTAWRWEGTQIAMVNARLDLPALMALDPTPWTGAPSGTTIGHVHLQVGDIAAAEPFYVAGLGLDITRRMPQALFISADGYHHHLALNTWNSQGAGPRDPTRAGLATVTLRNETPQPSMTDPWGTTIAFTTGDHP